VIVTGDEMDIYTNTISKISTLPQNLLEEVNDFIDFLSGRYGNGGISTNNNPDMYELNMSDYLKNLTDYENLLANGKIKW
jgi:hypothetical protein